MVDKYPSAKHIMVPNYGIRFHEAPKSKFPETLKKLEINLRFIRDQITCKSKTHELLNIYLKKNARKALKITHTRYWVYHYIKEIVGSKIQSRPNSLFNEMEYINGFQVGRIKSGDLCANTFMRYKPSAKLDINDNYMRVIETGARALEKYWGQLIDKESNSSYYFGTYGIYTHGGIPMRMAAHKGLGIVNFGAMEIYYRHYRPKQCLQDKIQPTHLADYASYRRSGKNLCTEKSLRMAETVLTKRTMNDHQDTMPYMRKEINTKGQIGASNEIVGSVVIMLHDFFDSPHLYRYMLFPDFITWAEQTIDFCLEQKIKVFVKPHPNEIQDSAETTKRLERAYESKNVSWIDKQTPNAFIFEKKPKLLITVYGSVVAEAAYMGIPVLLAGDHPGINFQIGFNPQTVQEYFEKLRNFNTAISGEKKEVSLFTAIHNQKVFAEDGDSLATHERLLLHDLDEPKKLKTKNIGQYTNQISSRLLDEIDKFLNTDKHDTQ